MFRSLIAAAVLSLCAQVSQAGVLWDANFSGASGGAVANIAGIEEASFLASSILGFHDNDGSGGISKDDTFTDYTVIRITEFLDAGGGVITPLAYGTGPGRTHELTIVTSFSGIQTVTPTLAGPGAYLVTSVDSFKVYADFGAGFTGSDFFNLPTFTNGVLVDTGVLGGLSGGVTNGPTAPDGTIDVIVKLSDALHTSVLGQYFELDPTTGLPLDFFGGLVVQGIFDANNLATPPGTPLGGITTGSTINGKTVTSGFDALFGISGTQVGGSGAGSAAITSLTGFDFGFATRSDGSFVKAVTPEPTSALAFLGLALTGIGFRSRRRA